MAAILTDLGEEYTIKNAINATFTVGLYNDSTDAISDANDLADITTEPSDGNYARQSAAFNAADISGDWGIQNGSTITFDVTNTTGTVDSYFIVVNFQATDTGDGSATDHLFATGSLSQSYDLSNITSFEINSATAGLTLT